MTKIGVRLQILVITCAMVLSCAGCRRDPNRATSVLGSTSIQPFAEILAEHYMRRNPDQLVEIQGGGSTAGLQGVVNGLADIGMCSRSLTEAESTQFTPVLIARDGLAIVVNPKNRIASLSLEQLRALFSGRIANWSAVGGLDGAVRPITREEGSGTHDSFMRLVMGQDRVTRRALTQESNGAVKQLVKGDPAAIGYLSLGLADLELRTVAVDGISPTVENVLAGRYSLFRPFLFVTKGATATAVRKFLEFVLSADGQRLLETEGLVRAQ